MAALRALAGLSKGKIAAAGIVIATAGGSLLLMTASSSGVVPGIGAGAVLAELAARSPGVRIGGVALKAKNSRLAPASLGKASPAGAAAPRAPVATVMSVGPVGAAPVGLAAVPNSIFAPDIVLPALAGTPGSGTAPVLGGGGGGGGGGGFIIAPPGGGSGGSPGGGGVIPPGPAPTPIATASPTPTPTPPVSAVPEPATWLMLIIGFGLLGGALRQRQRVRFA